jgi:hypothetical protein
MRVVSSHQTGYLRAAVRALRPESRPDQPAAPASWHGSSDPSRSEQMHEAGGIESGLPRFECAPRFMLALPAWVQLSCKRGR